LGWVWRARRIRDHVKWGEEARRGLGCVSFREGGGNNLICLFFERRLGIRSLDFEL
jgi:hypothetical protein